MLEGWEQHQPQGKGSLHTPSNWAMLSHYLVGSLQSRLVIFTLPILSNPQITSPLETSVISAKMFGPCYLPLRRNQE